ncbi:MAG: plasmid stabilization protein [Verrucomicrobia bacterium]|nr:plasmid stabilization protein [Verrucomicrobiota bacterium]
MTYRFASEALEEYIGAGRYYNRQVPGLGDAFADEIGAGIGQILSRPHAWRLVESDIRRYLVRRFPYGIYYTIDSGVIVIWAVKHLRREPDYWQERLG